MFSDEFIVVLGAGVAQLKITSLKTMMTVFKTELCLCIRPRKWVWPPQPIINYLGPIKRY